jgi:hypothetical protein
LVAVAGLVVWIPRYQAHGVKTKDTSSETAENQTATLINEYRRTLVQMLGGLFVMVGALSGAYFTWSQIRVMHEGQITDRFTRAIAQLGDLKLEVRLGGIYALERIARDSPRDQGPIVETLSAFIRKSAPAPAPGKPNSSRTPLQTDVQAALTVLVRRDLIPGSVRVDLRRTDLAKADLRTAHLEGAFLSNQYLDLEGFFLTSAHLDGANLFGAHLQGTHLAGTDLSKVVNNLTKEQVRGARPTKVRNFPGARSRVSRGPDLREHSRRIQWVAFLYMIMSFTMRKESTMGGKEPPWPPVPKGNRQAARSLNNS